MTARTLALVLIRVLAIKFLVDTVTELISQISTLRIMRQSVFEDHGSGQLYTLTLIIGIFVLGKMILGLLLLFYSAKIADQVAGSNHEKLEAHPQLAPVLTHIGILLVGLTTFIYTLPRFLITSMQWFSAHANMPEHVASQQNASMAQVTFLLILAVFLILRGKTLTRGLMRLSK